jgi:multicomponent K+:H+ antiporter subunit A
MLACLTLTLSLYPSVRGGGIERQRFEWIPSPGLDFALRIDGFAWIFAVLVSGIGFLVVVLYALLHLT